MNTLGKPSTNDRGSPDRWWILTFVAFAYFVLILHRSLVFYIQVPLSEDLGLTKTQAGMMSTAFDVPYSIAQLFVAYLSDRFRRRTVLAISVLASTAALTGTGFVDGLTGLLFWRMVLGFAQAASVPAIAGVMADCFTSKNRSTAIGVYFVSLNLAFMVAGKYGGALADVASVKLGFVPWGFASAELAGWRISMFLFSLLGAALTLLIWLFMREPARTDRAAHHGLGAQGSTLWGTIRSVVTVPAYWILAVAYILVTMVINVQDFWLARYFVEQFQMTNEQAGQFSTIWSKPSTMVGLLLGGFLADRWAQRQRTGRTLVQLLGMVACIPALYLLGTSGRPGLLALAMVLGGLGTGFYVANLWTTTFEVIDPAARSTAVGLLNVIGIGAAPAVPLVGNLADHQMLGLGQSIAGLSILAAAAVMLLSLNATIFLRHDDRGHPSPQ